MLFSKFSAGRCPKGPEITLLFLVLCACSPKVLPPTSHTDSVRVEIRERLVHDTVKFEVPVIKEKNVTRDTASHLENEWAQSDAEVKDGFLWHSLETKPHTVYVPVEVPVHDTTYIEKEAVETVITKEVEKPLTGWQKARIGAFWWLLILSVSLLIYTFRKPILTLLRRFLL